tara:strand:- start:747 stop:1418 length:672 start_codon:yes stop_codon:yes gene_type:complete
MLDLYSGMEWTDYKSVIIDKFKSDELYLRTGNELWDMKYVKKNEIDTNNIKLNDYKIVFPLYYKDNSNLPMHFELEPLFPDYNNKKLSKIILTYRYHPVEGSIHYNELLKNNYQQHKGLIKNFEGLLEVYSKKYGEYHIEDDESKLSFLPKLITKYDNFKPNHIFQNKHKVITISNPDHNFMNIRIDYQTKTDIELQHNFHLNEKKIHLKIRNDNKKNTLSDI